MTGDSQVQRVGDRGPPREGPMSGRFLAEGQHELQPVSGWLELLALLETARLPADQIADLYQEEDQ
jgi:hypothetical protein